MRFRNPWCLFSANHVSPINPESHVLLGLMEGASLGPFKNPPRCVSNAICAPHKEQKPNT